ncbi:MAG: imidazole glycerol phosphate synthase, glutamine amidotransferase subunit [Bacteroidetes bacterium GWA2_32_17]|nr:MAG: imidazole glycerol phosphate synthase, glutamine amidotransferase subunit [Bacteroidetes bacterium GWA2_32_17]
MSNIIIINYGMGNLNSIKKKLTHLKVNAVISSNPNDILNADKLILPGVGHFKKAIENLNALNLYNVINEVAIIKKIPILGICLGMQLMANKSEEGNVNGFGWFDADVIKFKTNNTLKYKIPHIGWNQITKTKQSAIMKSIPELSEFYFVHSYHFKCNNSADILNETEYDNKFTSAVEKDNIFGVQYHPEKSHDVGEMVLRNFVEL